MTGRAGETPSRPPTNRRRWAPRIILVGAVAGALLVLQGGLCQPFVRVYANWINDPLVDLVGREFTAPSPIGTIAWTGDGPLTLTGLPLTRGSAVEMKLRAESGTAPVRLEIDGHVQGSISVGSEWRAYRIWLDRGGSALEIVQPTTSATPIHISRVKVSNVASYSEGVFNAWMVKRIVPFERASDTARLAPLLVGLSGVLGLLLAGRLGSRKMALALHRYGSGVVGAALVLALCRLAASTFGFELILTPSAAVIVLLLPGAISGIWSLARWIKSKVSGAVIPPRAVLTGFVMVAVIGVWASALMIYSSQRYGGDIRGMARFGWKLPLPQALEDVPEQTASGYDGQFYAVLSADPFLRNPSTIEAIDNPSYRAQRALVSFLAWASVGGSARAAPYAYVLWCWVLGLAGPFIVWIWTRRSPWGLPLFAVLALNSGLFVSLTRATPDAAALSLMMAALLLADRSAAPAPTTATGALAVLSRETSLLALPGLAWPNVAAGKWWRAISLLVVPVATLAAWRAYVQSMTGRGMGSAWTNFGVPFGWLPEKVGRLALTGWEDGQIEWLGVAWIVILVACAGSYLVWKRPATPVLITFLFFSALASCLNMRVHVEVFAYARVLIVLPFLAALLIFGEQRAWRRNLLIAGTALASIQGALLMDREVGRSWEVLRSRSASERDAEPVAGVRHSGPPIREGARWAIPPGRQVRLEATSDFGHVVLGVVSGTVVVTRGPQRLMTLGRGETATLPLRPDGRRLELINHGRELVRMAPLKTSSLTTDLPDRAILVPAAMGTRGFGASNWVTDIELTNTTSQPQVIDLFFLSHLRDGGGRARAALTLQPGRDLALHDVLSALFDRHSAGALLLAPRDSAPLIRCRLGRGTSAGVSWVDVPTVPLNEAALQPASWSTETRLGAGRKWANAFFMNPVDGPISARLQVTAGPETMADMDLEFAGTEVLFFAAAINPVADRLAVSVTSPDSVIPTAVITIFHEESGQIDLFTSTQPLTDGAMP